MLYLFDFKVVVIIWRLLSGDFAYLDGSYWSTTALLRVTVPNRADWL